MRINFLILVLLFSTVYDLHAQKTNFGNIPREDWELARCQFDTVASMVVIFDSGEVSFDPKEEYAKTNNINCLLRLDYYVVSYTRQMRLKVLKSGGDDFTLSFVLKQQKGFNEKLAFFKVLVSQKVNGKIVSEKVGEKGLNKVKTAGDSLLCTYTCENPSEGAIIDIEYKILSDNFNSPRGWAFSGSLPFVYSEYVLSFPDFLTYNTICKSTGVLAKDMTTLSSKYSVWFHETSGNIKIKDYEYQILRKKYMKINTPGNQSIDDGEEIQNRLEEENLDKVTFKNSGFIMYR